MLWTCILIICWFVLSPVLRVWDVLLFQGNRVMLFRTALALMELYGICLSFSFALVLSVKMCCFGLFFDANGFNLHLMDHMVKY